MKEMKWPGKRTYFERERYCGECAFSMCEVKNTVKDS